jgi:hypothetical protein
VSDIDLMSSSSSECINESEGITDQLGIIVNTARNHGLNPPFSNLKAVEAGVLVDKGSAHPSLHIAHLNLEGVPNSRGAY